MTAERSGNAPRGRRGGQRPGGRPQQPGQRPASGQSQSPGGPRRARPGERPPARGQRTGGTGMPGENRGPRRQGATGGFGAAPARRPAGQRPPAGPQRRGGSGTSGWTTVRPWRPPRDDASEPLLDDEAQPDWNEQHTRRPPRRTSGDPAGTPSAAGGRTRVRPPAWPGGSANRGGAGAPNRGPPSGPRSSSPPDDSTEGVTQRPRRGVQGGARPPRRPPAAGKRPTGNWLPRDTAPNDE